MFEVTFHNQDKIETMSVARSGARLAQVQRHFSTTSRAKKEIQDAYIVSAARTPVGVVRANNILLAVLLHPCCGAPSLTCLPPNLKH